MMTCYFRDTGTFLRYCTLCTSICRFSAKGIKLTRFVLFEVLSLPQHWVTSVYTILIGAVRKFTENKRSYKARNFSAWLSWWGFAYVVGTGYFPFLADHWKDSKEFRQRGWKDSERPLFREGEAFRETSTTSSSRRGVPV